MIKFLLLLISISVALCSECKDVYPITCRFHKMANCIHPYHWSFMSKYCAKKCGFCPTAGSGNSVGNGKCGVVQVANSRIVGGVNAQPGAWPWQVALYHWTGKFFCGGSLVNNRWIVTAAHCVKDRRPDTVILYLGDHNRTKREGEQIFEGSKIIIHPSYDDSNGGIDNDIALVKLDKPVMYTKTVQPVCLPTKDETPDVGSKCYITGWGNMIHKGPNANILQQLPMTVLSNTACNLKNSKIVPVTKNMICGVNTNVIPNQAGCHGDSGGPFVCKQKDGSWKLHGAVSWGSYKCDIKHAYTVFARIAKFREWIDGHIKN